MTKRKLLTVCVAGLVLGVLLVISPAAPFLGGKLLAPLAAQQGWQLRIDTVGGSLLHQIELLGVELADSTGSTRIRIRKLKYHPWSDSIIVIEPHIELRPAPDAPAADTLFVLPTLPAVAIRRGSLTYRGEDSLSIAVDSMKAAYATRSDSTGFITLFHGRYRIDAPRKVATGSASGQLHLRPGWIEGSGLQIAFRTGEIDGSLELEGTIALFGEREADLHADLRLATAGINWETASDVGGRLRPMDLKMISRTAADLGKWGSSRFSWNLAANDGNVWVDSLKGHVREATISGGAHYDVGTRTLETELHLRGLKLSELPGSSLAGELAATATAHLQLRDENYRVESMVSARDLDLGPLGKTDAVIEGRYDHGQGIDLKLRSDLAQLTATGPFHSLEHFQLDLAGLLPLEPLLGRGSQPFTLRGVAHPDSIQVDLTSGDLRVAGQRFGPLQLHLAMKQDRQLFGRLRLEDGQANLQFHADLNRTRLESMTGRLHPMPLHRMVPGLAGTVRGTVGSRVDTLPTARGIAARFHLQDLVYENWHVGAVDLEAEFLEDQLQIRATGEHLKSRMQLDMEGGFRGRMDADGVLIRRFSRGKKPTLRGDLAMRGTLEIAGRLGQAEDFAVDLSVNQLEFSLDSFHAASLEPFAAHVAAGAGEIEEMRVRTSLGEAWMGGYVHRDSLRLTARITALDLGGLIIGASSTGSAALTLNGSMEQPQLMGTLAVTDLHLANRTFGDIEAELSWGDRLRADAELHQYGSRAAHLAVDSDLGLATYARQLSDRPTKAPTAHMLRLQLGVDDLDLEAPLSQLLDQPTRGVTDFGLDLSMPFSRHSSGTLWQRVNGELAIERLGVGTQKARVELVRPVTLAARSGAWKVDDLAFQFAVSRGDSNSYADAGRARLSGEIGADGVLDLTADVEGLDLDVLEGSGAPSLPEGAATARIQVADSLAALLVEGTVDVALEDLGEVTGSVLSRRGHSEAQLIWSTPVGDELAADVQIPWPPDPEIPRPHEGRLRLNSDGVDLFVFLDQAPQLENLEGTLVIDLLVDDLLRKPRFTGAIDLSDLEFALMDVSPAYRIPAGHLQFSDRRWELSGFSGGPTKGPGRLALAGSMGLGKKDELDLELRLTTADLPYNYDDVFEVPAVDMDLRFDKTGPTSRLSGYLRLDEILVEPTLIDLSAPPVPPPTAVPDESLVELELDISVDVRSMHVENELSDLDMVGGARVYGSFYKPRFQGQMEVERGKVFLLNRQFDIQKGRITLDHLVPTHSLLELAYDPMLLNPDLQVEASTSVQPIDAEEAEETYEVRLTLSGPARVVAPRFECGGLTDGQILTLLAFGYRSVNQLTEDDYQGAKSALYTAAGQLLLSRQVKKIGFDEFQILPSGTALGTVGKTSVRLGKYLGKPVPLWLRYEASTEEPSLGEIRLEHKLGSFLTLTGTAQSEYERYGLGIGIKKAF